jgi:hypothetical protein
MQVKIVNFEAATVAVLEHRGNPALLNGSVQRFIVWRKESGLSPIAGMSSTGPKLAGSQPVAKPHSPGLLFVENQNGPIWLSVCARDCGRQR